MKPHTALTALAAFIQGGSGKQGHAQLATGITNKQNLSVLNSELLLDALEGTAGYAVFYVMGYFWPFLLSISKGW